MEIQQTGEQPSPELSMEVPAADMWKLVPCVRGHSVTLHGPWKCLKTMMTLGSDWLCLDPAWTSRGRRLWVLCQFSDLSIPLLLPTSRLCVSAAPWSEHHDMNLEVKKPTALQKRAVILSFVLLMFFFLFPPFFFFFLRKQKACQNLGSLMCFGKKNNAIYPSPLKGTKICHF